MFKKLALAALLCFIANVAWAQTCPTRPTTDSSNACASTAFVHNSASVSGIPGIATMRPHVGQTTSPSDCYTLTDPYGNAIACTSSTTSQGLQEFLNATTTNGWPAVVACQGTQFPSGAEPILINASTSVTVPVAQDWSFHSYGCNLNFSSLTSQSGLIFDSQGATEFDWDGKIVYSPTAPNGDTTVNPSCAVLMKPVTNTADGFPGIYAGHIRIKNPVSSSQGGTKATCTVGYDATNGSLQNHVEFEEINGVGNTYYGFFVFNASPTTGMLGSQIRILQTHGHINAPIKISASSTNQANYRNNQWWLNSIGTSGATSIGIDTYGRYDTFYSGTIQAETGTLQYGIKFEAGTVNNQIQYAQIVSPSSGNVLDSGTGNQYSGYRNVSGFSSGVQNYTPQFVGTASGAGSASAFVAQAAQPSFAWNNTGAGADAGWWDSITGAAALSFRTVNDAQSVANTWLQVTRSGATPTAIIFSPTGAEQQRLISAHQLVGATAAQTMGTAGSLNPFYQLYGTGTAASFGVIRQTTPGGGGAQFLMGSSRSTPSSGSYSALQTGDGLGSLNFVGDIGTSLNSSGATIQATTDGNWSASSTPGRIIMTIAASGTTITTERTRWDSSGNIILGNSQGGALPTTSIAGWPYMPTSAGTPTGVPSTSYTGFVPMQYDTTNHKICIYDPTTPSWRCSAAM